MERLEIPEISGVTLLTAGEAEVLLTKEERALGKRWWVRTEGSDSSKVAYVGENGDVDFDGIECWEKCELVPALKINAPGSALFRKTFKIGSMEFIVVSSKLAILKGSIKSISFNSKETVDKWCEEWENLEEDFDVNSLIFSFFETSDIKKYLDKWYKEIMTALKEHDMI